MHVPTNHSTDLCTVTEQSSTECFSLLKEVFKNECMQIPKFLDGTKRYGEVWGELVDDKHLCQLTTSKLMITYKKILCEKTLPEY